MSNSNWTRPTRAAAVLVTALATIVAGGATAGADTGRHDRNPGAIELPGDPVEQGGSKFEGIGLDQYTGTFYISETTGGEISRGNIRSDRAAPWVDGDGTDGRWTARGITVDRAGRVYIAGGPNGLDHPGAPDLWVYSRSGTLLAALDTGVDGAFLNDVAIGPDGAAYFTNSNAPQVFRVDRTQSGWQVGIFIDATGTIPTQSGFNLGGIVSTPDRRALIVAQGNTGALWRVDLRSRTVTPVVVSGADLRNADGLVLRGRTLFVIRNFSRALTTVTLSDNWTQASLDGEVATDPNRVLTTGKLAGNRLYAVDSKFDEPVGTPPFEVVVLKVHWRAGPSGSP